MPRRNQGYNDQNDYDKVRYNYLEQLYVNLQEARRNAGIQREDALKKIHASERLFTRIGAGEADLYTYDLVRLCDLYQTSPESVLPKTEDKEYKSADCTMPLIYQLLCQLSVEERRTLISLLQTYLLEKDEQKKKTKRKRAETKEKRRSGTEQSE